MKRLLVVVCSALALGAFAAIDKTLDIKPTASVKAQSSVQWENANDAALTAATADEVLAAFVDDSVAAGALLGKVRGAYATEPMVACQIAAVSQWVMREDPWYCLWWDGEHEAGRKVWVKALLDRAETADDAYVKTFCLDQIRWCGCNCPCLVQRLRAIGEKSGKPVKDFAEVVVRELTGKAVGLGEVKSEE